MSFDRFHKNYNEIYRVLTIDKALGVTSNLVGITLPPLGFTMKAELPEVINSVRISNSGRNLIEYNQIPLYSENLIYTEKSLFEVFDYELVSGNPETALTIPNTAVLTEEMSKKIFGQEDPMGKTIKLDNNTDLQVVGVMEDAPTNSHMVFDVLISIIPTEQDSSTSQFLNSWQSIAMTTYVQLNNAKHMSGVISKMDTIIRDNNVGTNFSVTLQPLADTHLNSNGILYDGYNAEKSDLSYVYTLSIVGLIVVLIAAFNFMNLSTARSANRAKEVGMRKVLGALKNQLTIQFLLESIMVCLMALLVSFFLLLILSPYLDFGIEQNFLLSIVSDPQTIITTISIVLIIGLLAGIYPAFLLSGFSILKVLKGNFKTGESGVWLRKVLVITQFVASIVMIIGTLGVYSQLNFLKNTDKGFDEAQIITVNLGDNALKESSETLKNELEQITSIESVAFSGTMPGRGTGRRGIRPEGAAEDDVWIVSVMSVNEDYFGLMGMEIIEGRNYDSKITTDGTESIIINDAMAKALSWKVPIGRTIGLGSNQRRVIGVVKDFHFANMRHKIEPMILPMSGFNGVLSVKIKQENIATTLKTIEDKWTDINPNHPFEYSFFDEEFGQLYQSDEKFAGLIVAFTWLAVFIACLGLLGLSTFTAEQRIKEIGVRKVLGANVSSIIILLSKEFTKPVIISCVIAVPISYYLLNQWLEGFAYRIDMPWVTFGIACVLALIIAQLTVGYHSLRAAISNPVNALRNE